MPHTQKSVDSWPLRRFLNERPEMVSFLENTVCVRLDRGEKRLVIIAPVKSGKRQMAEYITTRDLQASGEPMVVHIFASAFIRRADEVQRVTLKSHGLIVHSINTKERVKACVKEVHDFVRAGKRVVVHIDEADYGTGDKQHLSKLWSVVRAIPQVHTVHYTATADELMCSSENFGTPCVYTPPPTYCGASYFLDNDLVVEATPFFVVEQGVASLSAQGRAMIADHAVCMRTDPRRSVIVLRLCYALGPSAKTEDKAIYMFLDKCREIPELATYRIVADKSGYDTKLDGIQGVTAREVPWSDESKFTEMVEAFHPETGPFCQKTLIVMDQTSSRSTEWCFHDRVFAFHEFRKEHVYATVAQSQLRVAHYSTKYPSGRQPIRMYGHVATFERAAGRITASEYVEYGHRLSERVSSTRAGNRTDPEVACEFNPCTPETFGDLYLTHTFRNPFDNAHMVDGRYQGYLREWKVFTFEEVFTNKGWGLNSNIPARVTVCYKDGVLGVAYRYIIDIEELNIRRETTHATVKSMYCQ